jgi:hypothetical protein
LTAILMSPPGDCFAMAGPHQTEGHYSLYLSLFGRKVKAGETLSARTRLVLAIGPSDEQVLQLYRGYPAEVGSGKL